MAAYKKYKAHPGIISEADLFRMMEKAHVQYPLSDHDIFKVGACMASVNDNGWVTFEESANLVSEPLKLVPTYPYVAEQHATTHAEIIVMRRTLRGAHNFLGCNLCFCPNCIMAASIYGVDALYYDASTFDNPVIKARLQEGWEKLGMRIARAAGLPIYKVTMGQNSIHSIHTIVHGLPVNERPKISLFENRLLISSEKPPYLALYQKLLEHYPVGGQEAGLLIAPNKSTGALHLLGATTSLPVGMNKKDYSYLKDRFNGHRYKVDMCPTMILAMEATRQNLELENSIFITNFLPPTGKQIDLVHAQADKLVVPKQAILEAQSHGKKRVQGMIDIDQLAVLDYVRVDDEGLMEYGPCTEFSPV